MILISYDINPLVNSRAFSARRSHSFSFTTRTLPALLRELTALPQTSYLDLKVSRRGKRKEKGQERRRGRDEKDFGGRDGKRKKKRKRAGRKGRGKRERFGPKPAC